MPTFQNPTVDAAEASEALRGLAHASRVFEDPADTYGVLGDLLAGVRSLRQVLDQLATTHVTNRVRAHDDAGDQTAGVTYALAATADERRVEIALLRTLGAHRRQLDAAVLGEFAALGLLAGLVAAAGAAGTGIALARGVFRLPDYWPPAWPLLGIAIASAVVVMLAGLAATRRIARTPPMLVLRRGT